MEQQVSWAWERGDDTHVVELTSLTLQLLKVLLLQFPLVLLPQAALGEPHWLEDGARGIGRTSTPEPSNDEEELGADIGWTLDSADGGLTMASRLRRVVA